jgi:diguanylate cyclase (GGDEF)-like protein
VRPNQLDPSEAGFRLGTLRAGIGPSFLTTVYGVAYALWTWNQPHRAALVILFALVTVSAVVVMVLPLDNVVRGRWCEPFFLSWSAGVISLGIAASALDGGAGSPMVVLLFLPLVFSALSYPLGSVIAVSAVTILAYLALAVIGGNVSAADAFLFACALLTAAWICIWQASNHASVRRDLGLASRTDPLTRVLNRRGLEERLAFALRAGAGAGLVLIDLDDFKAVNDRDGHAAGDELLCWVAERLRATARSDDAVARLGGDEFAILLASAEDAAGAMARIGAALAERAPASAGLAVSPRDGTTADELHRVADARLYARKRERRATSRADVRRAA